MRFIKYLNEIDTESSGINDPNAVSMEQNGLRKNVLFKRKLSRKEIKKEIKKNGVSFIPVKVNNFISEGGNIFNNTSPINAKNINDTLNKLLKLIYNIFNISENDVKVLGSAGKKSTPSGDLDIGLNIESLIKNNDLSTIESVFEFIVNQLNKNTYSDVIYNKGLKQISFPFKIENSDNLQENKFVQVDLMFASSLNWLVFMTFSPSEIESNYKGAHRAIFISNLAKYSNYKILKYKDAIPVEWERNLINKFDGFIKSIETNIGKTGNILKSKTILDKIILSNNPEEVTKFILGPKGTINDLNSFESIFKFITSNKFNNKFLDDILKDTAEGFQKAGLIVPKELEKFL